VPWARRPPKFPAPSGTGEALPIALLDTSTFLAGPRELVQPGTSGAKSSAVVQRRGIP